MGALLGRARTPGGRGGARGGAARSAGGRRGEAQAREGGGGGPGERTAGQVCVGQEPTAGCRASAPEADCFSLAGRGTRRIRGWLSRF